MKKEHKWCVLCRKLSIHIWNGVRWMCHHCHGPDIHILEEDKKK